MGRDPPRQNTGYSQQADGTHPTGMHTCDGFFGTFWWMFKKVTMHKYWLFVMVKVAIFLGWVGVANNFWVEVPKNFGGGKKMRVVVA